MAARTALPAAATKNDPRQPYEAYIQENSSGTHAPPMPAPEAIQPHARARASGGFQLALILPAAGYMGAAKMPINSRNVRNAGTMPINAPRPGRPPSAVIPVNNADPNAITASDARGPEKSVNQPPGIIMIE